MSYRIDALTRRNNEKVLGPSTLTDQGREFRGLRGWSGKPLHPPLTDFPIAAYVLAAVFDVISAIGGEDHEWAHDLWRAGTYAFIGGVAVSGVRGPDRPLGRQELVGRPEPRQRRTINTHATIMISVTVLAIVDLIWRLNDYHTELVTPAGITSPVGGRRRARFARSNVRRNAGLRLRLQRRDSNRFTGVAQVGDRRAARPSRGADPGARRDPCRHSPTIRSAGGGLVANQHPVITNRKPTTVRSRDLLVEEQRPQRSTATTGLTKVINPARAGPASAMSPEEHDEGQRGADQRQTQHCEHDVEAGHRAGKGTSPRSVRRSP
jgi:uncharacterized membrane protein